MTRISRTLDLAMRLLGAECRHKLQVCRQLIPILDHATQAITEWGSLTQEKRITLVIRNMPSVLSIALSMALAHQAIALYKIFESSALQQKNIATEIYAGQGYQVNFATIARAHLFGRLSDSANPSIEISELPATTIALELRGIVNSSDDTFAHAIISDRDSGENVYFIGDALSDGVVIRAIQGKQVVLDRDGSLEILELPSAAEALADNRSSNQIGIMVGETEDERETPEMPVTHVTRLSDIAIPRPKIVDGKFLGIEIYPGENLEAFTSLGLKAGDLITAIDNNALVDGSAVSRLTSIAHEATLSLTVDRKGAKHIVRIADGKLVTATNL